MRDRKPMWFNILKDSVGAACYCTMVPFLQNIYLVRYLFHHEAAYLGLVFLFLPDTHDHKVQPFPK